MTVSFAPYLPQGEISVQDIYGGFLSTPNIPASIPKGFKAIAFRPPKKGEGFLTVGCNIMVANSDYSESAPRIIVETELSEIEKVYGQGTTIRDLWKQYCPNPEYYGKPLFGEIPKDIGHVGVVWQGIFPYFTDHFHEPHTSAPRIYAPYLNVWQRLYGKSITDAEALEKFLRDRKDLQADQELEPELRVPLIGEVYIHKESRLPIVCSHENLSPRAIVRKKVQQYLKLPLEGIAEVLVNQGGDSLNRRIYKRQGGRTQILSKNAQIVEE